MESSVATPPGHDEKRLAELGYKQTLNRAWSGFSNFAISFTIISILAGCFTTYGQAWNNGGPIAISIGWPLISIPILIIGFCMSELVSAYPTAGGIYWWAGQARRPGLGLVHRLVQPDRPGRRRRLGRLRLRDLPQRRPRPLRSEHLRDQLRRRSRTSSSEVFLLFALILIVHTVGQHPPHPPALAGQQRLGLVARDRRRGDRPRPDLRPRRPPERQLRLRPPDQQQRLQRQHVLVLRAAARLPADPVHDHRLRRLGPHLRGDARRLRIGARRASGSRSSTRR